MSSQQVKTYYLVDKQTYDIYMGKKTTMDLTDSKFPKRVSIKIQKILKLLASCGLRWSTFGYVKDSTLLPNGINVFQSSAYTVTGIGEEPDQFDAFIKFLISNTIFQKLLKDLCLKIRKKINSFKKILRSEKHKKSKRKDGKQVKTAEFEEDEVSDTNESNVGSLEESAE